MTSDFAMELVTAMVLLVLWIGALGIGGAIIHWRKRVPLTQREREYIRRAQARALIAREVRRNQ